MKRYFLLAILLQTIAACDDTDELTEESPKLSIEPQIFLNSGDTTVSYNYQNSNELSWIHYQDSYEDTNPDSVIVDYRVEFTGATSYLQLTFFKSFLIDSLDNEVSSNFPYDYSLSERELLKIFQKGEHLIVDHEVNFTGPLLIRPSNGTNIRHFRFLSYDPVEGINNFKEFGSAENEGNYFEINEITKLTLDNIERGTQDLDLTPVSLVVYNTVYAIKGSFDVNMYARSFPESETLISPEFTFVVYTDKKEQYR
ncbi:MAG: hypothetical protein WBA23_01395 [Tunicatimonas sp.]|uniref:hypothetical protein n=1 Tax=Tunicatimonas sp. TaxID=1940096 RepID=UPI003C71521A